MTRLVAGLKERDAKRVLQARGCIPYPKNGSKVWYDPATGLYATLLADREGIVPQGVMERLLADLKWSEESFLSHLQRT